MFKRAACALGYFSAQWHWIGLSNESGRAIARHEGLSVTWFEYRGPAQATFASTGAIPVSNGQSSITVRFAQPGTYILRATASDGELSASADVTVTVRAGASDRR